MLMVIFGAGASYDSCASLRVGGDIGIERYRPPLAKDLFRDPYFQLGDLVTRYQSITHVLSNLRTPINGRSVEEELEALQSEGRNTVETAREMVSVRYYLHDVIQRIANQWIATTSGETNYAALARQLLLANKNDEPIIFATFNYDNLLEIALLTFDAFQRVSPADFLTSHKIFKVIKLHGSVGWMRLLSFPRNRVPHVLSSYEIISEAQNIEMSDAFVTEIPNGSEYPGLPAIGIPLQNKTDQSFECPPPHRAYLEERLPHIRKLLIIGWQGKEAHFLSILRGRLTGLTDLMVVGKDREESVKAAQAFSENVKLHVAADRTFYGQGGFSHFILNREGNQFYAR